MKKILQTRLAERRKELGEATTESRVDELRGAIRELEWALDALALAEPPVYNFPTPKTPTPGKWFRNYYVPPLPLPLPDLEVQVGPVYSRTDAHGQLRKVEKL